MSLIDIFNLITSVTSIILAIVSLILSIRFADKSDESLKKINDISIKIEEKTQNLEKLFDLMQSQAFALVREQSRAMQDHIFKGEVSNQITEQDELKKLSFEILQYLISEKRSVTKNELKMKFNIEEDKLTSVLNLLKDFPNFIEISKDTYQFRNNSNLIDNS